jgi:hypothetical protein
MVSTLLEFFEECFGFACAVRKAGILLFGVFVKLVQTIT